MPASRPTFPSDSPQRRLGTGGGPGGNERLLRAQLVIATLLGFTILAVLLYLWRRPSGTEHAQEAVASASASAAPPVPAIVRTKIDPPKKVVPRVTLGPVQHVQCGASAKLTSGESSLCDSLTFVEQGLPKAITDSVDCAPKGKEEGTISYVVAVDFRTHDLRVYPGRSGSWRGKQAKAATECVKRALGVPPWATMTHQYRHYLIAMLATYPPADAESGMPNFK
jgi:hypothetical protein